MKYLTTIVKREATELYSHCNNNVTLIRLSQIKLIS